MGDHNNPFGDAYVQRNLSYTNHAPRPSTMNSANVSIAANDSSGSLTDPILGSSTDAAGGGRSPFKLAQIPSRIGTSIHSGISSDVPVSATGSWPRPHPSGHAASPYSDDRFRKLSAPAPIRIPRRSDAGLQDVLRTPSSALTDSFPLPPPPRTPGTPSVAGTFGSLSGHTQRDSSSSGSRSSRDPPSGRSSMAALSSAHAPRSPVKPNLSVPPPTPAIVSSRAPSTLGDPMGHWDGETSSVRDSEGHPNSTQNSRHGSLPYYSPNPAANTFMPTHEDPSMRIRSFAAEWSASGEHISVPPSPAYPPRAYSPVSAERLAGEQDFHHSTPSDYDKFPGRSPYPANRRDSAGTFGTVISSAPSIGMNQAINTLESEGFFDVESSIGTPNTGHTRAQSEVSIASSPGMTHELIRRGNIFESMPASNSGLVEGSRRLARASLVSSQLLRLPDSIDALRSNLLDGSAHLNEDNGLDGVPPSRPPTRARYSNRYSSGPAPTLASLAEDDDDPRFEPAVLDYEHGTRKSRARKSRHSSHSTSRRDSNFGSKSTRSVASHKSGKSSAHFTVASHAPSLPSLHMPGKRAEIAVNEATLPFKKLAKRASTLGEILDNMPGHVQYTSYPASGARDPSYDEISELRYSNQLRKARRKVGVGIPGVWGNRTPVDAGIKGTDARSMVTQSSSAGDDIVCENEHEMQHRSIDEKVYHVHPAARLDEQHFRRRRSYPDSQIAEVMSTTQSEKPESSAVNHRSSFSSSGTQDEYQAQTPTKSLSYWKTLPPQRKRKVKLLVVLAACVVVVAAIAAAVPLSRHSAAGGGACDTNCVNGGISSLQDGQCICQCSGNFAGTFCELDATCTCPDQSSSCPQPLAKSVLDAAAVASTLFSPPINASRLAATLATSPYGTDCAKQVALVETPNLSPGQYKSRRRWVQAILLWDAATSQDWTNTALPTFQKGLSYWQWQDTPSFQAERTFQIAIHGYTVDFAYEKVFAPPKTLNDLSVEATDAGRMGNTTATAFAQVGSYAAAAATQRSTALEAAFTRLGYTSNQLATFIGKVQDAPALFPFDAGGSMGGQSVLSLAGSQADNGFTFPIPAACTPGLSAGNLDALNAVEKTLFGLESAASLPAVRANCSGKPLYGRLNLYNLRTPFLDPSRPGQAAAIAAMTGKERMSFYAGQLLTPLAYAATINTTAASSAAFGTMNHMENVLYDYLEQIGDDNLAKAVVDYVLSDSTAPPDPASSLYTSTNGLQSLPVLEVQLWGGLLHSDIDYIVSSLAQPAGNALFGSNLGGDLRSYAHRQGSVKPIRWSLSATSAQYANDDGGSSAFQGVWASSANAAPSAISQNIANAGLLSSAR